MAVVNCRECGKSVSTEAATCPHCGAPKPAGADPKATPKATAKPLPKWLAWAAGLTVVLAIVSTCSGEKAPDPAPAASAPTVSNSANAHQAKDFGITPDEFRDRYNAILGEVMDGKKGDPLKLQPLQISQGKNADSFKQEISKAATYVIGRSSKSSGKLDDLTIGIGGGNGKASTAANAMLTAITLTRAATGLSVESGVANVVIDVLGQATDQLKTPDKEVTPRVIQGYRISGVGLKDTGILLSVSPEK